MKNLKEICLLAVILLVGNCLPVFAGTNPAAFLDLGEGARALGMGGAFVSVADDYTAAYWNPAGLGLLEKISVGTMVQSLAGSEWDGMKEITPKHQFFSFVLPANRLSFIGGMLSGAAGFSWIRTQLNDIPHTLDTGVSAGSFTDREDGYIFSYGREIFERELFLGGNFKFIQQGFSGISGGNASGWGLDGGLLYRLTDNLRLGLVVQKGIEMKWENGHRDIGGLREKLGLNYQYLGRDKIKGIVAFDVEQTKKEPLLGRMGTELKFFPELWSGGMNSKFKINNIGLRAGLDGYTLEDRYGTKSKMNSDLNWTFGFGVDSDLFSQNLALDYSFGSHRLGDQHRISLGLNF
ncbi:MAG: hypothetical protein ABII74_00710 [Elusimicrobiota bacterium]